jgi:hypothetical protein
MIGKMPVPGASLISSQNIAVLGCMEYTPKIIVHCSEVHGNLREAMNTRTMNHEPKTQMKSTSPK